MEGNILVIFGAEYFDSFFLLMKHVDIIYVGSLTLLVERQAYKELSDEVLVWLSVWIQTGFTFLVPAYPGCRGKEAAKQV